MTDTFMTFRENLDSKDSEIARLKHGYDSFVFRQFLRRFVRVHQSMLDLKSGSDAPSGDLTTLTLLLEDALEECGVATFEPELEHDYRLLKDRVADNPETIATTEPAEHFTVAEVVSPGYEILGGEEPIVLVPAQVKVFSYREPDGET